MSVVAALFVQSDGCYVGDPLIDPWTEDRDARLYDGSLPIVAHPPCQRWGVMSEMTWHRFGLDKYLPGADGGCFMSALWSVEQNGGVLEHPARSRAWGRYGLVKPTKGEWTRSGRGWVCEVWQSAYGHRADKVTWLYYVGKRPPFEMRWARPRGPSVVSNMGKKARNATPLEFRNELLWLALYSQFPETA